MPTLFRYTSRRSGIEKEKELVLHWEIDGDPITDEHPAEDISASDLWDTWLDEYASSPHPFGPGWFDIHWHLYLEAAPFAPAPETADYFAIMAEEDGSAPALFLDCPESERLGLFKSNFLTHYSWPTNAETGEALRFTELPVVDKLWRPGRSDKGGFIQEVTGWKPSALQPVVHMPSVAAAAGLPWPYGPEIKWV